MIPAGFEPGISALKGRRPRLLVEGTTPARSFGPVNIHFKVSVPVSVNTEYHSGTAFSWKKSCELFLLESVRNSFYHFSACAAFRRSGYRRRGAGDKQLQAAARSAVLPLTVLLSRRKTCPALCSPLSFPETCRRYTRNVYSSCPSRCRVHTCFRLLSPFRQNLRHMHNL